MKTLGRLCKQLYWLETHRVYDVENEYSRIKRLYNKNSLEDLSPTEIEKEIDFLDYVRRNYEETYCVRCGDELVTTHKTVECLRCGYIAYQD